MWEKWGEDLYKPKAKPVDVENTNKIDPDKIEKTSMVQDDLEAYIYNASFDNEFHTDYFDEF